MPGKLLGFDFGRATSPAPTKPAAKKGRSLSFNSQSEESRTDSMDHFKRPSLAALGKHSSDGKKDKDKKDQKDAKNVRLDMIAESPPALFIGDAQHSTGALYSLKVKLTVKNKPVTFSSFNLRLDAVSSTKRPVADRCPDCISQSSTLKDWKFITETTSLAPGEHEFPASYLIPGHLPVTTHGHIGNVDYKFVAKAVTSKSETFDLSKPLIINRAVPQGSDKNSVRIFPPTNLTLNVTLPSVIHPIGDFNVYARMSGITTKKNDTQTRWRLRKMTWRVEEHEKSVSPACTKHAQKVGGEGKGIAHDHTRGIGEDEIRQGWKTDFEDGQIEGEFVCAINNNLKPNVDIEAPNGLKITHTLVLELVIAEEWAPNKKPNNATPTGAARVLRTQFNVTVTERAGMGIAWDDEQPPLYEDVPDSPPAYIHVEDYHGNDLNDDIDHLHLGS